MLILDCRSEEVSQKVVDFQIDVKQVGFEPRQFPDVGLENKKTIT